ncbi:KaiC domain-containing protein [Desulfurococcus mucosus]|uniref:Putative circadian clock protein, KaiC n=1 Tax=Desulfurococcus mucosus (strain ATCC 35584 / DSM 2162 / JCM 9187 / O7/1) TaxID=765177 RepID=E8R7T1_DESM0|nr:KaiC domain-containing protein [Desulfurococcus mucosus]ADV64557.1 putative circadian clock protein, KaiC [Desulfurococcus mucosus DSM 2162]
MNTERIPSGVPGLDELIDGGIPRGFMVAVVGEPGTGKTAMSIQFIAKGLETGDKAVYVTTEESRESILRQAERFNIGLKPYIEEGRLVVVDALMGEYGDVWSLKELDVEELVSTVIEAKKYLGPGHARLVVDSMSAFWLDKPAMARKYSYHVKRVLSKWGFTMLVTSQYAVTTQLGFGFGIEHVADGVIRLRKSVVKGFLKRFLVIEKMRLTNHDQRVFEIEVVDGVGVRVNGPVKASRWDLALPPDVVARLIESGFDRLEYEG